SGLRGKSISSRTATLCSSASTSNDGQAGTDAGRHRPAVAERRTRAARRIIGKTRHAIDEVPGHALETPHAARNTR
ncbi:MAG TPA: hypothetical protein VNU46_03920, partial [Gemmatimonadaceae bacterium]|nr:hypothetical protein [Gemmatimonadaceae bacterium]